MVKVEDLKIGDVILHNGEVRRVGRITRFHDERILLISWGSNPISSPVRKDIYVTLLEEFDYVDD